MRAFLFPIGVFYPFKTENKFININYISYKNCKLSALSTPVGKWAGCENHTHHNYNLTLKPEVVTSFQVYKTSGFPRKKHSAQKPLQPVSRHPCPSLEGLEAAEAGLLAEKPEWGLWAVAHLLEDHRSWGSWLFLGWFTQREPQPQDQSCMNIFFEGGGGEGVSSIGLPISLTSWTSEPHPPRTQVVWCRSPPDGTYIFSF